MNKDLDDRLIPNGEYRDAQNISVGKSEDDDIGALETVLGNTLISATNLNNAALKIIGYVQDEYNDKVFVFATDYTDGTNFNSIPINTPAGKRCIIYSWSAKSPGNISILVDNVFLNFSTTNPIQATLIEELLFFTDNRNQPRKISIDKPVGYYTDEIQISVAKYNPFEPISLVKKETGIVAASPTPTSTVFTLDVANPKITVGMSVVSTNKAGVEKIKGNDFITVANVNGAIITLSQAPVNAGNNPADNDNFKFLSSTMSNKSSDPTWPGDPNFLEDKFVRFSYRFKFDDGEYSIMAPFTQIAYIPKQKGYFINGDEDAAYRSTILSWMENNVNNVDLLIPLPDLATNIGSSYKIIEMDVLYKESDALVVKVLESLTLTAIQQGSSDSTCTYSYQSRKPYKTLPQAQTVRVYDKVPVRALAQETSGNRIIYGNIFDVNTPPSTIDYTARSLAKTTFTSDSWIEYPNHSLKQNRSYQVGFILADKFGRQSSVILSPVTSGDSSGALGSTIYSPYYDASDNLDIKNWFGDTLQLTVDNPITSGSLNLNNEKNQTDFVTGQPGLYAIPTGSGNGFQISDATNEDATIVGNLYTFRLDASAGVNNVVPVINNYLRGEFIDYVKVTNVAGTSPYVVTTNGQVNKSYLNNFKNTSDIKFSYSLNQNGWYSYKVVVKQTEQDYYNVYLPGILKGYPQIKQTGDPVPFPNDPLNSTSNIVLINDNINKVPRDLAEVGPDQKQFRSSVQLFGRVQNTVVGTSAGAALNNIQYYPDTSTDTAISIATTNDSNMEFDNLSAIGQQNIYQIDSKPLIARLATSTGIGVVTNATANLNMQPFLAIYETEPTESLLDIFWETTSVGMLSDLNADIETGYDGPSSISFDFSDLKESINPGTAITDEAWPLTNEGTPFDLNNPTEATSFLVVDGLGQNVTSKFFLSQDLTAGSDKYKYQIKSMASSLGNDALGNAAGADAYFVYENNSSVRDVYTFTLGLKVIAPSSDAGLTGTLTFTATLLNEDPLFDPALTLISATVDQTILRPLSPKLTAFNGTSANNTLANKTSQLEWTITAGNPTGVNGQPCFQIDASNGQLTQTPNNTPNGLYTLTITLKDSVLTGSQGTGGDTITSQQQIRIGPTPVNAGVASFCKDRVNNAGTMFPNQATIAPFQSAGGTITAVWYLSNNTSTGSARATYLEGTGWPSGCIPTNVATGQYTNATYTNTFTIHRLGNALTQGSVALSLNMQMNYTSGVNPPSGIQGQMDSWRVYHRTNNTQAWTVVPDINNHTIRVDGIQRSAGQDLRLQTLAQTDSYYLQYVLAYDKPGEYLIVAKEMQTVTSQTADQALVAYCNSSDLNYSECVIEDGTNQCSTSGGCTYQYGMSGTSSASNNCSFGLNNAFSLVPYGQYVDQFFQTSSLINPYSFTTDATDSNGVTHTNYLSYKMKQSSPYNDSTSYKYSFSARFTTAAGVNAGKVYNPPSWGTNSYVYNCGNLASSQSQDNVLALTFPYTLDTTTIS